MEDFYDNVHYKSGWKPLAKEDDSTILNTYKSAEILQKENTNSDIIKSDEVSDTPENNDILKMISEVSTRIDALNRCMTEQSENINNLLSLMKAETTASKKSTLGSFWK